MTEKIIKKASEKYEDFWEKHNITSRTSIFIFIFVYLFSIVYTLLNPPSAPVVKIILDTTSYTALIPILAVIFGPNTFVKITDIITNKKFKNNVDYAEDKIVDTFSLKTPKLPKDD